MTILTAVVLVFLFLLSLKSRLGEACFRRSFLAALILWGVLAVIGAEALSLFSALTPLAITLYWSFLAVFLSAFLIYDRKKALAVRGPVLAAFPFFDKMLIAWIGAIVVLTATIAFFAPPNNWDSMTYHMARVMHWLQDRTMAHYPTSIPRQNVYSPAAEIFILHLTALSGGDRWVNFVQWFSMVGSLLGVSLIARDLGAGRSGQVFAALFAATLPMGILQSTSTQNDYVAVLWMVAFIFFGLQAFCERKTWAMLLSGLSLGLAFLTKGTTYFLFSPFLLWFLVLGIRRSKWLAISWAGTILALAIALNAFYFYQNLHYTGHIVPASESAHIIGSGNRLAEFLANVIRNVSLHLVTPWATWNHWAIGGVNSVLQALESEAGAKVIMGGGSDGFILTNPFRDDIAGNFFHLALIIGTILLCCFIVRKKDNRVGAYGLALLGAFVLFHLLLKWSPFHSRYHLSFFVLIAPWVAVIWEQRFSRKVMIGLGLALALSAIPWVLGNEGRPLIGQKSVLVVPRQEQYFSHHHWRYKPYASVGKLAQAVGCREWGLGFGPDSWEYPLWALFGPRPWQSVRIEHVTVGQLPYPRGDFSPCMLLFDDVKKEPVIVNDGKPFLRVQLHQEMSIYVRVDHVPPEVLKSAGIGR
ncbi:MAG: glycosyltransferase family 39 protein [Candidatus Omnitrophica bacterium]|nr:glycosyltransferase family 39 protein [Candidatus Omnitrophota bacterium]